MSTWVVYRIPCVHISRLIAVHKAVSEHESVTIKVILTKLKENTLRAKEFTFVRCKLFVPVRVFEASASAFVILKPTSHQLY
jgi:hypothetical protein